MATFTRPATWDDVLRVAKLLNKHKVRFVLVGGYALYAHGIERLTADIDIAVDPSPANSKNWILALAELPDQATAELLEENDPFGGDYSHTIRINDEFTIDIMPSVAGIPFEQLASNSETLIVNEIECPLLSLRKLLDTKQGHRPKDRADAERIREVLEILEQSGQ